MWWRQRRLRLLQPEGHAHLAVHRSGGCQVLLRLGCVAGAAKELAEAEVAVGGEWAHGELLGKGQRLTVAALGPRERWRVMARGDLAEEPEGARLDAVGAVFASQCQGSSDEVVGLLRPSGKQARLAEVDADE